jgi:hypothetical protein
LLPNLLPVDRRFLRAESAPLFPFKHKQTKHKMKTHKLLFAVGAVTALTFVAGCDSKTNIPPAGQPTPAPSTPASPSTAVGDVKPAVTQAATAATAEVTAKFNSVVDQAKSLLGQNKYTEALNSLQGLSGLKLTPEQEQVVTDLKAQIQKLMAAKATTDGAGAVGNLLKK